MEIQKLLNFLPKDVVRYHIHRYLHKHNVSRLNKEYREKFQKHWNSKLCIFDDGWNLILNSRKLHSPLNYITIYKFDSMITLGNLPKPYFYSNSSRTSNRFK